MSIFSNIPVQIPRSSRANGFEKPLILPIGDPPVGIARKCLVPQWNPDSFYPPRYVKKENKPVFVMSGDDDGHSIEILDHSTEVIVPVRHITSDFPSGNEEDNILDIKSKEDRSFIGLLDSATLAPTKRTLCDGGILSVPALDSGFKNGREL